MPVEERWAYVYTVRGGKVCRVELWNDRDAGVSALDAVGLSKWRARQILPPFSKASTSSRLSGVPRGMSLRGGSTTWFWSRSSV